MLKIGCGSAIFVCMPVRLLASFVIFVAVMNTGIVVVLLSLGVVCAVLGLLLLSLRRDNARLSDERAAADEARRLAEESRRVSEEKSAAAEIEIRTLVERSTLAQARLEAAEQRMAEARAEREKMEETFRTQFKNLANDILGEQSRTFKETNREALDVLLKPFRDNIVEFRERVEKIYSSENEQRGALRNELERLMELNRRITTETTNLTNALKGNSKVQGDWGEMILETILDNSNLIRGVHYDTQLNIKDEAGNNLRPDVVLYLPEGKRIVIDSKVSLTAFVASVRLHVVELGRKEYQRLLDSPDFVIMFIPNEPAFLAALQNDSSIWADAYDKKVIISSPTNLFALLKLVDDLWKRNAQNKNTADIVTYGTKLYEQLVAFTASLEGVGQSLDAARDKYNDAYKRLCTGNDNIVRCGERLRKLGIPTKKQQSARTLQAADLPDEE